MKLAEGSISWALKSLINFSDTDLFPQPIEYSVLGEIEVEAINKLKEVDTGNYQFGPARRFIVPKDEMFYRTATQLDPLDNLFLTAIIYQFGGQIEARRRPTREQRVFSHRFSPQSNFELYDPQIAWVEFWQICRQKAAGYGYAIYLDIADFYNQIYHHIIENQLGESGMPNPVIKWVMGLIENVTARVSRGIPVGPHATHLLAEMTLTPLDNSLLIKGLDFCRYADDIVVFCRSKVEARIVINQLAEMLDKQQRLILQQQKTRIFETKEFIAHCNDMIEDRPINQNEKEILEVLQAHSKGKYVPIDRKSLSDEEIKLFSEELVEKILSEYLRGPEPNYARLRWFLRRLSQIGVPSAVNYCIKHANDLLPAIGDMCRYLISVGNHYAGSWQDVGAGVFDLLEYDLVKSNEYFQISLLSLFSRNSAFDHISKLIHLYNSATPNIRREILLSAYQLQLGDWIRELKESYPSLDTWNKRAFIIATKFLPREERRFFLKQAKDGNILNELLISWAQI